VRRATVPSLAIVALAATVCSPAVAQQAASPPNLDHRKLIAENLAKLFSADAQVRNVVVSELRQVPSPVGLTWGACVRVNATSMAGKPTLPRTYVVTFTKRNDIAERRAAESSECAGARFEPLR
jgi:hypothetical protein